MYITFLSLFSLFMYFQNVSMEEVVDFKFVLPSRTLYFLVMILLIYLENIYIVEKIRHLIIMKEYIVIRIKSKGFQKQMLKSLMRTLVSYVTIEIIWCIFMLGYIPLYLLMIDLVIKLILVSMIFRLYMKDNIYVILFIIALFCRIIIKSFILLI